MKVKKKWKSLYYFGLHFKKRDKKNRGRGYYFIGSVCLFNYSMIVCLQIWCICSHANEGCKSKMKVQCMIHIAMFGPFSGWESMHCASLSVVSDLHNDQNYKDKTAFYIRS